MSPAHLTTSLGYQVLRDGLGFEILSEFKDQDGFDGVMLGHEGVAYHLEFTRKRSHKAGRAATEDNLLVFYLPIAAAWKRAVARLEELGYRPVKAFNPYWDKKGRRSRTRTGIGWSCRTTPGRPNRRMKLTIEPVMFACARSAPAWLAAYAQR